MNFLASAAVCSTYSENYICASIHNIDVDLNFSFLFSTRNLLKTKENIG